jgi:hypothetical protein
MEHGLPGHMQMSRMGRIERAAQQSHAQLVAVACLADNQGRT